MGGAVSAGRNNEELINNLIEASYIEREQVERVFKCVDRGFYLTPHEQREAYKDLAWRSGNLHLSAPCIYAKVLEALELQEGCSFLNIGSGTGYLSTMAGLLIGARGVNHGVELQEKVVEYSQRKFAEFMERSDAVHEFEICAPQFVVGNALLVEPSRLYSRVYCGAAVTNEHEPFLKNLLSIGGVLVMPLRDQVSARLMRVTRVSETEWSSKTVLPVSFASLVQPTCTDGVLVKLPDTRVPTLCELCRVCIRAAVREHIRGEVPPWSSYVATWRDRRAKEAALSNSNSNGDNHDSDGDDKSNSDPDVQGGSEEEDSDGTTGRARKRGCFGMLSGLRSRHSRLSRAKAASTSSDAPNDSSPSSANPNSSSNPGTSAPSAASWRTTPRVSGVQFTVNGTPRRFIRITLPGSSYFFEQPGSRANADGDDPDSERETGSDATNAYGRSAGLGREPEDAAGSLEQVINELFVEPRVARNSSSNRDDGAGDAARDSEMASNPSFSTRRRDSSNQDSSDEDPEPEDIFPRFVGVTRPAQRRDLGTETLTGADKSPPESELLEPELPDYFGEKSELPSFKKMMRSAVDQLGLPFSLRSYVMYQQSVARNATISVSVSESDAKPVNSNVRDGFSANISNCLA